ncbi:MAG TPA: NADH-ubiquinone oxidoreductase-F iron-sulfur binding region domain-containing protein [Acidimicrobiales bacterium]|nr:NADH-ubiquinone oxidoreductase-F iron-sulfur binding region domain-containing protein [Acidimicrobiales bacterium]
MTMTAPTVGHTRLLAGPLAGNNADLAAHTDTHGPLDLPRRHHGAWSQSLLDELARSGLTGRGGAGFPAARKLDLLAGQRRRPRLVVNAMEGEPASAKDRLLLERAPHLVLDGAQAAALAIDATLVVCCVADDRPESADALRRAMAERAAAGLDVVPVELRLAPGRYSAGEESALVDWVGGGRGLPTFRPDKSVPLTVGRSPVLLHNAETLAHVALIARHGADWFRAVGLPDAPGTTLVTVTGAVRSPGVVEVELGTPLDVIVQRAEPLQAPLAVLLGGYGGTWMAGTALSTPYAPGPLAEVGGTVGAGVIGVLGPGGCGLAETARIVSYLAAQSAGQCGPCVFGMPAIADDLHRLAAGQSDGRLLDRLQSRLTAVDGRGACRLPDGAVRLVRSALSVFAKDVTAHARRHPCPGWNRAPVMP